MNLTIPAFLLVIHFVADWRLQPWWMGIRKSSDFQMLYLHVLIYSMCFIGYGAPFVVWTFILHIITDAITSRITSRLWFIKFKEVPEGIMLTAAGVPSYNKGPDPISARYSGHLDEVWPMVCQRPDWKLRDQFFLMIGFDQLVHALCLAITYRVLHGG